MTTRLRNLYKDMIKLSKIDERLTSLSAENVRNWQKTVTAYK